MQQLPCIPQSEKAGDRSGSRVVFPPAFLPVAIPGGRQPVARRKDASGRWSGWTIGFVRHALFVRRLHVISPSPPHHTHHTHSMQRRLSHDWSRQGEWICQNKLLEDGMQEAARERERELKLLKNRSETTWWQSDDSALQCGMWKVKSIRDSAVHKINNNNNNNHQSILTTPPPHAPWVLSNSPCVFLPW